MKVSWCKVSSLTAAIAETLKPMRYPATRTRIVRQTMDVTSEGWDVGYFLSQALSRRSYQNLREIMADVEKWAEGQG